MIYFCVVLRAVDSSVGHGQTRGRRAAPNQVWEAADGAQGGPDAQVPGAVQEHGRNRDALPRVAHAAKRVQK